MLSIANFFNVKFKKHHTELQLLFSPLKGKSICARFHKHYCDKETSWEEDVKKQIKS